MVRGFAVPASLVLHEGYALALDGVAQDAARLAGKVRHIQCGDDLFKVVAVGYLDDVKAEGAQLAGKSPRLMTSSFLPSICKPFQSMKMVRLSSL